MTGISGGAQASNYGECPYDSIDFNALTHVMMFTANLRSNGQMNIWTDKDDILDTLHTSGYPYYELMWGGSGLYGKRRRPFVDAVHTHGKPILLTLFGGGISWTRMVGSETARNTACRTIVDSVIGPTYRYDGVDFDIESWSASDSANTRIFFIQVYDSLQKYHAWYDTTKKPLMTTASTSANEAATWKALEPYFDQMNHMSYDMFNGTYTTVVWHNNAIFRAGAPGYGNSIQGRILALKSAGLTPAKLGAGLDMNGWQWMGGKVVRGIDTTEILYPLDVWLSAYPPVRCDGKERQYWRMYKDWLDTATTSLKYDTDRKVPYLSFPGNQGKGALYYPTYITFDDTSTMREGILYADTANLGGVILWGVADSWLSAARWPNPTNLPGGKRDAMLQAVKTEAIRLDWYRGEPILAPKLLSFGNVIIGGVSSSKTFLIEGGHFTTETGIVTVTMPTGFLVSKEENSGYSSIVTISYTDYTLASTTLYAVFSPAIAQDYSGNITIIGGGIGQSNVLLSGIGVAIQNPVNKFHYTISRFKIR